MKILCTDLEGTLAPEIWQELGEHLNIPELNLTTRDIPNFEDLMKQRMETLKKNEIKFSEIKKFLAAIEPFEGAKICKISRILPLKSIIAMRVININEMHEYVQKILDYFLDHYQLF